MAIINISIPPLTRGLLLGLVACTLLNAGVRNRVWLEPSQVPPEGRVYNAPFLTIIPATSVLYPWTFLTATLAEQNAVGLVVTGATLFYGGRYLERAYSSREYTKFSVLVALLPNLLTFLTYYVLFIFTQNTWLISTAISGGVAVQAAFLVAFKQLVPEHAVQLMRGVVRVRVKHFPAVFLLANTLSGLLLGTYTAMLLAWFGFMTSWTYLRFYRTSPSLFSASTGVEAGTGAAASAAGDYASVRGDASDTFSFAAFFPDVVQPPIAALSDAVFRALVAVRVCTPFTAADVDAGNEQASAREGGGDLPTTVDQGRSEKERLEAERRRAIALRALDQRLNAHAQQSRAAPPRGAAPAAASAATSAESTSGQADKKLQETAPVAKQETPTAEPTPAAMAQDVV